VFFNCKLSMDRLASGRQPPVNEFEFFYMHVQCRELRNFDTVAALEEESFEGFTFLSFNSLI